MFNKQNAFYYQTEHTNRTGHTSLHKWETDVLSKDTYTEVGILFIVY